MPFDTCLLPNFPRQLHRSFNRYKNYWNLGSNHVDSLVQRISTDLEKHAYKMRIVPVHHLQDLQQDIVRPHAQGLFDEDFFSTRLSFYDFQLPETFPIAKSIIVVAAPSPQTRVTFTQNEKTVRLTIPPTYVGYNLLPQKIEAILTKQLAPDGYKTASTKLPLKTLAVHSGLCEYGRNNITFIAGMGSFFQLVGFFTDLPCPEDNWRAPIMMERCQKCKACINNCPTSAIPTDRFLLHAEHCLVFFNERPPEYPFPNWIAPSAHNSLIGCMTCQQVCPENKEFLDQFAGELAFSHAETSLLLHGAAMDQIPPETVKKLERIDMMNDLQLIPRNLGVFFN
jgi:epoxyqueuosine reductase